MIKTLNLMNISLYTFWPRQSIVKVIIFFFNAVSNFSIKVYHAFYVLIFNSTMSSSSVNSVFGLPIIFLVNYFRVEICSHIIIYSKIIKAKSVLIYNPTLTHVSVGEISIIV